MAGKVTLIKSGLKSLPIYFMALFKISNGVAEKIESIQRRFLWNGLDDKRKIHWIDWRTVCLSKCKGGLGIGNIRAINQALLAKWVWRFSLETNAFWKQVLCAKYGLNQRDLSLNVSSSNSFSPFMNSLWRLLYNSGDFSHIIQSGFRFSLGNGEHINFWTDVWVGECSLKEVFQRIFALASVKEGCGIKKASLWLGNLPMAWVSELS